MAHHNGDFGFRQDMHGHAAEKAVASTTVRVSPHDDQRGADFGGCREQGRADRAFRLGANGFMGGDPLPGQGFGEFGAGRSVVLGCRYAEDRDAGCGVQQGKYPKDGVTGFKTAIPGTSTWSIISPVSLSGTSKVGRPVPKRAASKRGAPGRHPARTAS